MSRWNYYVALGIQCSEPWCNRGKIRLTVNAVKLFPTFIVFVVSNAFGCFKRS